MTDSRYKTSFLWRTYLSQKNEGDEYERQRSRLRHSFEQARAAVVPLVANIASELPDLTVHDITHLDALWTVADTLLGENFTLNPAEVYVLGLTFLMHDAATSSYAFPRGVDGLKDTVQWQDFVSLNKYSKDVLVPGSREYQITLFETLRMLHAAQAEILLTTSWKDFDDVERYLIEDVELRNHYGSAIGKIAASHGLDAVVAENQWSYASPISSHSSLMLNAKADWSVDCLKISMILRCIDAAHIDSLRAPDVRAYLASPKGESKRHWQFQNKLGSVALNAKNEIYWSGSTFSQDQSDAWWRCYETCRMIDKEIKVSNRILADHNRPVMLAKGVNGAQDILLFQKNVPVQGWVPVDFSFQVSQVGKIIENFGGERLYGNKPYFALRELIQNSADSIRARRVYCGKLNHGQIDVSLRKSGADWWLDVADDGIGMSRYVLTDVLLDFGRSLWKDSAIRNEWSGLTSKGFIPVGQFGIGFFSVFMLGDEVKVTTWQYGASIEQQSILYLRDRVNERPLLLTPSAAERLTENGTKISIKLRNGRSSLLQTFESYELKTYRKIYNEESLSDLVGWICPTLDIDITSMDDHVVRSVVVNANDWKSISDDELLARLYPRAKNINRKVLTKIIEDDGTLVGRAMLNTEGRHANSGWDACLTYRGIRAGTCHGITGVMLSANNSDLARNNAEPLISPNSITAWAKEQLRTKIKPDDRSSKLSERGVSLGVKSENLIVGKLNKKFVSIKDLLAIFKQKSCNELVFVTSLPDCPDDMAQSKFDDFEVLDSVVDLSDCSSLSRFDFGINQWLKKNLPESDDDPRTVMQLIINIFRRSVRNLEILEDEERPVGYVDDVVFEEDCVVISKV